MLFVKVEFNEMININEVERVYFGKNGAPDQIRLNNGLEARVCEGGNFFESVVDVIDERDIARVEREWEKSKARWEMEEETT